MAEPVIVTLPHKLGKDEAKRRLKAGLRHAATNIAVVTIEQEVWDEDRLIFRVRAMGQAVSGIIDVAEENVRIEVMLPWLLKKFADVAQNAIKQRGQVLLEKKPS